MKTSRLECLFFFVLLAATGFAIWVASVSWSGAILDCYGFRQTQTAISCLFTDFRHVFFHYETPVLGPPWSVPFEFPFYQMVVFWVSRWIPLDQAGRVVSLFFYVASFFPILKISEFFYGRDRKNLFLCVPILLSPTYLFWSRTFMIESTALFFSLMFVWCSLSQIKKRDPKMMAGMMVFGALGALVKITTFFAFAFAVSAYLIYVYGLRFRKLWPYAFLIGIPVILSIGWTQFADTQKMLNPLGFFITSKNLQSWNFGTLAQKLSPVTWKRIFGDRLEDAIGGLIPLFILIGGQYWCTRREKWFASFLIFLYFLTFATFTNLQFIHSYYEYSCAIFLAYAMGIVLRAILIRKEWLGIAALLVVSTCMLKTYFKHYYPVQRHPDNYYQEFGKIISSQTDPGDILLVYGLDWSSELPYYAGRRAIMDRSSFEDSDAIRTSFQNVERSPYRIGAMAVCDDTRKHEEAISKRVEQFHLKPVYQDSRCSLYRSSPVERL